MFSFFSAKQDVEVRITASKTLELTGFQKVYICFLLKGMIYTELYMFFSKNIKIYMFFHYGDYFLFFVFYSQDSWLLKIRYRKNGVIKRFSKLLYIFFSKGMIFIENYICFFKNMEIYMFFRNM